MTSLGDSLVFHKPLHLVLGALTMVLGLTTAFAFIEQGTPSPVPKKPFFMKIDMIEASLEAMRANGVLDKLGVRRATDTIPIKHVVLSENRFDAERVRTWAKNHGFKTSELLLAHGHGGVEIHRVEIGHRVPASPLSIKASIHNLHDQLHGLGGQIQYHTWMADYQP